MPMKVRWSLIYLKIPIENGLLDQLAENSAMLISMVQEWMSAAEGISIQTESPTVCPYYFHPDFKLLKLS
jgi:hypothetical protein